MTTVTVRDLLRLLPGERLRLMAGGQGLSQPVRWATSVRATPPYLSHVMGGELVLLMSSTVRAAGPLPRLIGALAERGAVGAVTDQLSTDAVEAADAHGLPLLLAAQTTAAELENELNRLMSERLNHLYSVSTAAGRRFAELAAGGGLAAILEHAATLVGETVLWEDERFVTIVAVPPPNGALAFPPPQPPLDFRPDWQMTAGPEGNQPVETPPGADGYRRLVAPVVAAGSVRGYVSAVTRQAEFTDVHRVVVQRAAEACAFELLRSPGQRHEESPAIEALLIELLQGQYGSESAALARAKYLGLNLEQPHLVAALDLADPAARDPRTRGEATRLIELELRGRLGEALIVRGLAPAAVALAPLGMGREGEHERVTRALTDCVRRLNQRLREEERLAVGLGDLHSGLEGYARAFQEALYALRVGAAVELPPPASFADMGVYRLLFPLLRQGELRQFRDRVLGDLLTYDQRRNSEMIETLTAYFASGCNVVEAADRLHVHRNSLAYRLRRIAEITGHDLRDQDYLFLLQLALHVHRVLAVMEPEPADAPA